jgi:hypothetical protein
MPRTYRVELPKDEALRLAGIGKGWPPTPETRCVHAIREWLATLELRHIRCVTVAKISRDLWPLLDTVPLTERPLHGPFAPPTSGDPPLPGHIQYLGAGTVRLDDTALSALAELGEGEAFRVTFTGSGAALTIGTDHYPAHEEPGQQP